MAVALRFAPVGRTRPATSLRLLLAALVLAPVGLLPAAASADPEPGQIVVEAAGSRSLVVDVPAGAVVSDPVPELSGGGDYAAVVVERLQGGEAELLAAAVVVRAFRDDTAEATGLLGGAQFPEGRYRFTLLADAPVRARWQLNDSQAPGLHLVARTPVAATFLGRAEPLASDLSSARVDLARALPAGKRALQVTLLDGTRADEVLMCATTADDCPRPLLPTCPPSPAPCPTSAVPLPTWHSTGEPTAAVRLTPASQDVRALRWAVEGYREQPDRLRAAALVF